MPRINLLPWREQERKVRRREFGIAAGAAVVAALVFALGGKLLAGKLQEIKSGIEPGQKLVKDALVLERAIDQ